MIGSPSHLDMRRTGTIAMTCLLAVCGGCRGRPGIGRLSESSVVVAFGDSLTAGTGAGEGESYPSVLSGMIGCRVVNAGLSGEDTTSGLRRLPGILETERPDLVILCHGGNDMLGRQDRGAMAANLDAMVSMAKAAGADVILVAVPSPGLRLRPPPLYEEVAARRAVPLVPDAVSEILSTPALRSDFAHPNGVGYRKLAESVAALIREREGK